MMTKPWQRRVAGALLAAVALAAGAAQGADVVISEIMALNNGPLRDRDQDTSDWIELYNAASNTVDLGGWRLSVNATNPKTWTFPSVALPSDGFLVVFASGKGTNGMFYGTELHTSFKLKAEGNTLALLRPDGVAACAFAPYPPQFADLSYGEEPATTDLTFVAEDATATYSLPRDGLLGTAWTAWDFDDTGWTNGPLGLGYETAGKSAFEDLIQTRLPVGTTGVYTRLVFPCDGADSVDILRLSLRFDDGFVAYLNGQKIATSNAPPFRSSTRWLRASAATAWPPPGRSST